MTTTVRARTPADLAVLLPYQLGYHPGPSVVLIALSDKRLGLVQRHDLLTSPDDCAQTATRAVDIARREGATGLILLGFEDEADPDVAEVTSAPLREAMVTAAKEAGVPVTEHVLVRDGRCFVPDRHESRCPPSGMPLPRPEDVPAVAAYVGVGVAPFASREALVADVLPERDEGRAREVGLHLAALGRSPGTRTFGGGPTRGPTAWEWDAHRTVRSWSLLLDPRPEATPVHDLPDADLARMAASLQDVQVRDALMAVLCPGTLPLTSLDPVVAGDVRTAAARCAWTHPVDEEFDDPDHEELAVVRGRLVQLTRLVPEAASPDALALVAHLAWFAGDGTVTGICLERALEIAPGHRLSGLMMRLLSVGVRPWSVPGPLGPPEAA